MKSFLKNKKNNKKNTKKKQKTQKTQTHKQKKKKTTIMKGVLCLFLFLFSVESLIFVNPPPGPLLGFDGVSVFSSMFTQLYPYADRSIFNTNVSVVLALDVGGCDPSLGGPSGTIPNLYQGKVVWNFDSPCSVPNHKLVRQWIEFQRNGAIGLITSIAGTATEHDSSNVYSGGEMYNNMIPVIAIKYLQDWFHNYDQPDQPEIGTFFFAYFVGTSSNPPNLTLTVTYEFPPVNFLYDSIHQVPSVYGFVLYTGISLALISLIFCSFKMAMFVGYEGPKLSIPQIVLTLCLISLIFNLIYMLWGPIQNAESYTWGPVTFFFTHHIPYWFSAVVVYGFYLAEISFITQAGLGGLDKFTIPCILVCASLWIIDVAVGSTFAVFFPAGTGSGTDTAEKFSQILTLLASIYLVLASLVTIFTLIVTTLLVKALLSTSNFRLTLQIILTSFGLILMVWLTVVGNIFIARSQIKISPQWGEFSPQMASNCGWMWGPALGTLLLASIFRISVHKEIEISKSGTSSTSGMSSGSSSSSSSSSSSRGADPVIEL
jgi:uncharacterized membrane protein YgcG